MLVVVQLFLLNYQNISILKNKFMQTDILLVLLITITIVAIVFVFVYFLIKLNFRNRDAKLPIVVFFMLSLVLFLFFELIYSSSYSEIAVRLMVLSSVLWVGVVLVKNIKNDIEIKKETERLLADLSSTNKNLIAINNIKTEFLAISIKRLRGPLLEIEENSLEILNKPIGNLKISATVALQKIFESSVRLVSVLDDFTSTAQIDRGEMSLNFSVFDIGGLVEKTAEAMSLEAEKTEVAIFTKKERGEHFVCADHNKIYQVIYNLIDNAIKYTPKGSISIILTRSENRKSVRIEIKDTGVGMNKKTKERLFEKFSRAEGISSINAEGSGLGLYIAKEIIKKHKGRIWVESDGEGKGSSFFVQLNCTKS